MARSFVDEIFSSVSSKYDIMNDLMSVGLHRMWKRFFVKSIDILQNSKILDVASGTGDIAIKILKKYKPECVVICDQNFNMLKLAQERIINQNLSKGHIVCADAQLLPFRNDYFDYYTVAFGVRNFSDIKKALSEAHRVLKPGGKFSCLEFSNVENKCLSRLYDMYSYNVIPFMGEKITGNRGAYEYLIESIRQFSKAQDFSQMIEDVGFSSVAYQKLSSGIVAIHSGIKTSNPYSL